MRRRLAFTVLSLGCASALGLVPACSSNNGGTAADAGDASIPANQLVGQPCDPTLANPCAPVPSTNYGCFTVACVVGICVESRSFQGCSAGDNEDTTFFEGGVIQNDSGTVSCTSNEECPSRPATDASPAITYVCGYSAFAQCATTGICVSADPPHVIDGAVDVACGCNGQPVLYVTDDLTSAPVQSSTPCSASTKTDSGTDAAADAKEDAEPGADAATDAEADAGADSAPATDADIDATTTDAATDAPSDAQHGDG